MAVPVAGMAKFVGSAVGQVGIQLALEKAFFDKDVEGTTKKTENAFSKSFKKIKNGMKKTFEQMKNVTKSGLSKIGDITSNTLTNLKNRWTETFHNISNIIKGALLIGSGLMVKFGKDAVSVASETQGAWTGLNSIVTGMGQSFSEAKEFLEEYTKDGLIPLTDAVASYKNLASRGYETEQIEGIMTALKDASAFGRQSAYSYGEAIKSATEGLKNENSILVDNAGVTKNVAKMWDEYAESIGTTANNLTLAQKRLAEYNGIMEETKFQTGDAQRYADTYAGKLAKVSTAFYNLKVAVGQVITPFVELFLPVIEKSTNALTKLFNKLKSIMSVFGLEMKEYIGKDTSSAISGATDSANGLTSGLESAGDTAISTAKKIKKAFAPIDEINVLDTSNNSSDGSNGGGSGGSDGGSSDTITEELEETQSVLTQKLDWLKRSAYDWGVALGEAINNGLGKIPWDSIQDTVVGAVSKVAQFLNGAVKSLDWHLLGSTFGEGFNTIIYGLNTFFKEFNWEELGKGLGNGVNGIIDSVDWKTAGEYLGRKFSATFQVLSNMFGTMNWSDLGKSLGTYVHSAIKSIDWNAIGDTFIKGFNGVIDMLYNFLAYVDWRKLGLYIYNELDRTIKNIDWEGLGLTIGKLWNSAFAVLSETIGKKEFWTNLGDKIVTSVNTLLGTIDWKKTGTTVSNFVTGITGFIVKLLQNVDWEKAFDEFLNGVDIAQILADILEIKFELKKAKWQAIGKIILDGIWDGIKMYFREAFYGFSDHIYEYLIKPWEELDTDGTWYEIGWDIIAGIFKGIWGIMNAPFKLLKELIWDPFIGTLKAIFGISSPAKNMEPYGEYIILGLLNGLTNVKTKALETWNKVKGWFTNITKEAKIEIKQKWNDIKSKWTSITDNIKDKTATMKAKIGTTWSSIKSKWSDITNNIKDKTATMKAKVGTTWGDLKSKWNNLMSNFKDKTITIKAKIGEVVGSFKDTINENLIKPINKKLPSIFPKIPYLAQGGWLDKNNPTLAVVGDNKREPEIVAPESKIRDQVVKGIEEAGAVAQNQRFDFTIKLEYPDGKYLIKEINNAQIKDGKISLLV